MKGSLELEHANSVTAEGGFISLNHDASSHTGSRGDTQPQAGGRRGRRCSGGGLRLAATAVHTAHWQGDGPGDPGALAASRSQAGGSCQPERRPGCLTGSQPERGHGRPEAPTGTTRRCQ